jgi:hypothetical protein
MFAAILPLAVSVEPQKRAHFPQVLPAAVLGRLRGVFNPPNVLILLQVKTSACACLFYNLSSQKKRFDDNPLFSKQPKAYQNVSAF